MIKMNFGKDWTTHMGVLVRVLLMSEGDVVELGAGPYSTPLLHWVCKDMNRRLITYENDLEYYSFARQYRSKLHRIIFVNNWDELDVKTHRGVVFIDHSPFVRRGVDAIRFKDSADYIVMHDSESGSIFIEAQPHFKYTYTWKECRPWVSVMSNSKDLSRLEK